MKRTAGRKNGLKTILPNRESAPRIAFNLIAKDDRVGVWIMRADGSRRR